MRAGQFTEPTCADSLYFAADEGSYTPEERESYIEIILSNTGESCDASTADGGLTSAQSSIDARHP